jgi:dihydrofolate reductase
MRKLVVYELLSLDGIAEAPETFFGWDDAMDPDLEALIATQDAVILGRRTYAEWAEFWPGEGSVILPFAPFINTVTKHIATSRPLDRDWTNTSAIDLPLVEFVRRLKEQPGGDIGVHGSISVAQSLLAAGLVDELSVVIGPMVAGRGRRLLDATPSGKLELLRSSASPAGYLLADYRVQGEAVEPLPEP